MKIQSDIDAFLEWADTWLMSFHPEKCKVISFGNQANTTAAHPYSMNGVVLDHVKSEKDLGVLDENLSFEEHILSVSSEDLSLTSLLIYYFKVLVRPHLEYSRAVWPSPTKRLINALEKVQMRAVGLIPEIKHLTYSEKLEELRLPLLVYRRIRGDMIEGCKHFHKYDQDILPKHFDAGSAANLLSTNNSRFIIYDWSCF